MLFDFVNDAGLTRAAIGYVGEGFKDFYLNRSSRCLGTFVPSNQGEPRPKLMLELNFGQILTFRF